MKNLYQSLLYVFCLQGLVQRLVELSRQSLRLAELSRRNLMLVELLGQSLRLVELSRQRLRRAKTVLSNLKWLNLWGLKKIEKVS